MKGLFYGVLFSLPYWASLYFFPIPTLAVTVVLLVVILAIVASEQSPAVPAKTLDAHSEETLRMLAAKGKP